MMRSVLLWLVNWMCFISLLSCISPDSFHAPDILCEEPLVGSVSPMTSIKKYITNGSSKQIKEDLVIGGYVVSDDRSGNFYKSISLQSASKDMSISILLDGFSLYTRYREGSKLYIKLKGLSSYRRYGQVFLGEYREGNTPLGIPKTSFGKYILRSCESRKDNDLANEIRIKDISDKHLNTLIELRDVQFVEESVGRPLYDSGKIVGYATNHVIEDRQGYNLIIRTGEHSVFKSYKIPLSSGKIRGVLSKYKNDYQLFLRYEDDLKLDKERFFLRYISIAAIQKKTQDKIFTSPYYIEGVISLSGYADTQKKNSRNISNSSAIIQDDTGAIALYFNKNTHQLMERDRVRVHLLGRNLDVYAGRLRLETLDFNGKSETGLKNIEIISSDNNLPLPKETTIRALVEGKFPLEIVMIKDMQIPSEYLGLTFSGKKSITDCVDNILLHTRSEAVFSRKNLPDANGAIIGLCNASKEILLINTDWVSKMTKPRCEETMLYFEQDFETLQEGAFLSEGWYNISEKEGHKLWEVNRYGGNHYVQASGYGVKSQMTVWLITPPIDLGGTSNAYLRFRTKDAYNNGDVLEVNISTNFDGTNLRDANWKSIDTHISNRNFSGYGNVFEDSGKINLSAYSGPVSIGFKYHSDPKKTTTIQIDEIQIFTKKM